MDTETRSTSLPDTADSADSTGSDVEAIRALVARAQGVQDDTDSLMSLHTPDVVIVNVAGRRVLGREAFAVAMDAALASPLGEVRTTVEILDVRFATPDVAIVSCLKEIHDGRAGSQPALPTAGALTYVMTRSEEAWRIALTQTTPHPATASARD